MGSTDWYFHINQFTRRVIDFILILYDLKNENKRF